MVNLIFSLQDQHFSNTATCLRQCCTKYPATYCPIFLSWLPADVTLPVLRKRIATAELRLPDDPLKHRIYLKTHLVQSFGVHRLLRHTLLLVDSIKSNAHLADIDHVQELYPLNTSVWYACNYESAL